MRLSLRLTCQLKSEGLSFRHLLGSSHMTKNLDEAKSLLLDIDKTVAKLDESFREKAFDILAGIAFGGKVAPPAPPVGAKKGEQGGAAIELDTEDLGEFVGRFDHDKEKDNVRLMVAWLYSQYGNKPFLLQEVRDLAHAVGLTIPARIDMTIKTAKRNKKSLFQSTRRGWYRLTVEGERYMKDTYDVKKGTKPRPTEEDE